MYITHCVKRSEMCLNSTHSNRASNKEKNAIGSTAGTDPVGVLQGGGNSIPLRCKFTSTLDNMKSDKRSTECNFIGKHM